MVIISIEEAIEGEITLEAIIEETSRITITMISIRAIPSSRFILTSFWKYDVQFQADEFGRIQFSTAIPPA